MNRLSHMISILVSLTFSNFGVTVRKEDLMLHHKEWLHKMKIIKDDINFSYSLRNTISLLLPGYSIASIIAVLGKQKYLARKPLDTCINISHPPTNRA